VPAIWHAPAFSFGLRKRTKKTYAGAAEFPVLEIATPMKNRYRLFRRAKVYYCQDSTTGKQTSLRTVRRKEAEDLLHARNAAKQQPLLNLELAKAYLSAADPKICERTWAHVMREFATHGRESTRERSGRMIMSRTLDKIRDRKLVETTSEELLILLRQGGAAMNNYMRRYHNLALNLGWLVRPILPPALWPKVRPKLRRAITPEEYERIIAAEGNAERRAYYQILWETGAAQTDGALICGEDVDWEKNVLIYHRQKLRAGSLPCGLALSASLAKVLQDLPSEGYLFPRIAREGANVRAAEFRRRRITLKIEGISLHSFRYAWAERACSSGIPERFAQAALGHGSKAIHLPVSSVMSPYP
jgi:integrase